MQKNPNYHSGGEGISSLDRQPLIIPTRSNERIIVAILAKRSCRLSAAKIAIIAFFYSLNAIFRSSIAIANAKIKKEPQTRKNKIVKILLAFI